MNITSYRITQKVACLA